MRLRQKWHPPRSNLNFISFYLSLNTNNKLILGTKLRLKMSPMKSFASKIQVSFHQINFLVEMLKKMIVCLSILNELSLAKLLFFQRDKWSQFLLQPYSSHKEFQKLLLKVYLQMCYWKTQVKKFVKAIDKVVLRRLLKNLH